MGLRFRKSFKVGPFRTTISKSGISTSVGVKGARITKRADGKTQTTLSVPGTGISYVKTSSGNSAPTASPSPATAQDKAPKEKSSGAFTPFLAIIGVFALALLLLTRCGADEAPEPDSHTPPVYVFEEEAEQKEKPTEQAQQSPEAESPEAAPEPEPEPEPAPESEPKPELKPEPAPAPVVPAPAPDPEPPAAEEPVSAGVIGNKNSKKFHEIGCSSVDDMKESNKVSIASYDAAISMGYEPCSRCH